ncbi:MAG: 1-acyl-sn-glycerol-3-phosphate acyltransferase [Saprospiraceae bacterium]
MLYRFFHVLVSFSLRIFFRKIEIYGEEVIKPGVTQILASNHPSGFLEPLLMACFFPRPLYFLVRGDVFENKFLKPILVGTHQLPIYRFKDGFSKLRENKSSLQAASDVLLEKKCILIFAEGSTKSIKMVRPLQKGFVRLASDTLLRNPKNNIEIVPVGINFSDSRKFRGEVMIRVGKPITLKAEMFDSSVSNVGQNTSYLLENVHLQLKKNVIHLEKQTRLHLMEDMFLLAKIKHERKPFPKLVANDHFLQVSKVIAQQTDNLEEDEYNEWKSKLNVWKKQLNKKNISLEKLSKLKPRFWEYVVLILGFIPAILGLFFHCIPLGVAYVFTRTNVKSKEFYGSVWFVANIVTILVFYIVLIVLSLTGVLPLYVIPLVGFTGYFAQYYYEVLTCFQWSNDSHLMQERKTGLTYYQQYIQYS